MIDRRYASRKFVLACFALLSALCLLLAGRIDQSTWSGFCTWVLGLYVTGNVGAAFVAKAATILSAPGGGTHNNRAGLS